MKQLSRERGPEALASDAKPFAPDVYTGRGGEPIGRILPPLAGSGNAFPLHGIQQIDDIILNAEGFVRTNAQLHPDVAVERGKEILGILVPSDHVDPFSQVLRAIFWTISSFGAERVQGHAEWNRLMPKAFGGKAQTSLTRAFLGLSSMESDQIQYLLSARPLEEQQKWRGDCVGAFAVSRLAAALLRRNVMTVLPRRKIDFQMQIDLIGVIPREEPVHLLFQVKYGGAHTKSQLDFLEDWDPSKLPLNYRRALNDMNRFRKQHEIIGIPMFISVANDGSHKWDLHGSPQFNEIIDDLIEYVTKSYP